MAIALEQTEESAKRYRIECDSAWQAIKKDHDRAMIAMGVDDLVGTGIWVLDRWLRHAERWHEWVSEDPSNYDPAAHKQLGFIESLATGTTETTVELIDQIKSWGYEVHREEEFRDLAKNVLGPTYKRFDAPEFAALAQEAQNEYENGNIEEISNWGD